MLTHTISPPPYFCTKQKERLIPFLQLSLYLTVTKDDAGIKTRSVCFGSKSLKKTFYTFIILRYYSHRLIFRQYYNNLICIRIAFALSTYLFRLNKLYHFIAMILYLPSFKGICKRYQSVLTINRK